MNDWKAKEAAEAVAVRALIECNPHLVPVSSCRDGLIAATKNMRIELALAFPGVKFSIKSSRFSGGDSIDVKWTDVPTAAQVDDVIQRYAAGTFNCMDDSYTYSRDYWLKAFGDAKYVMAFRRMSETAVAAAIRLVRTKFGDEAIGPDVTVEAFERGSLMGRPTPMMNTDLHDLIARALYRQCYAMTRQFLRVPDELETA